MSIHVCPKIIFSRNKSFCLIGSHKILFMFSLGSKFPSRSSTLKHNAYWRSNILGSPQKTNKKTKLIECEDDLRALLFPLPDAELAIKMSTVEQIEVRIGHQIQELAATTWQGHGSEGGTVLEVEHDELLREGDEEDVPPPRGEAKSGKKEREESESRGGWGGPAGLPLDLLEIGEISDPGDLVLLYGDVAITAPAQGDGGEKEAPETEGAEVPGVERIAADAREVLRGSVVLPEAAAGGGVPQGEEGGAVDGGEEPGVGADPAEVLDPEPGAVGGGV